MEIPGNEIRKVSQQKFTGKQSAEKSGSKPASSQTLGGQPPAEQISVSSKAKDMQRAHEVIKSSPDIRTEKVNRIKKEIADGTFRVETEELAGKILKDIITERTFLE